MTPKRVTCTLLLETVLFWGLSMAAQPRPDGGFPVSSESIMGWVEELCSPKFAGRLTGTEGYNSAAKWVAGQLGASGVAPGGDGGTYFQEFPNPYTVVLDGASLAMELQKKGRPAGVREYRFESEFIPGSTSDSGAVTAEVVYVGYGITAQELGFDEYAGLDVRGKIVLLEREVPVSPDRGAAVFNRWRPYSFHDYKTRNAAGHGAAGVLYNYGPIANPNNAFVEGLLITHVGATVMKDLFAGTGRSPAGVKKAIDRSLRPASFPTGKTFAMVNLTEHHPEGRGSNVVGRIEGADPAMKGRWLVLSAHLDHVGMNPVLMPGARDNATGVAALLAVARAFHATGERPPMSLLLVFFGAEEQGVAGSDYFIRNPLVPLDMVMGDINLDLVGCGSAIAGLGGADFPGLWAPFQSACAGAGRKTVALKFDTLPRPRLDSVRFAARGIPAVTVQTTGGKAYYHTSQDRPETVSPSLVRDVARVLFHGVRGRAPAEAGGR